MKRMDKISRTTEKSSGMMGKLSLGTVLTDRIRLTVENRETQSSFIKFEKQDAGPHSPWLYSRLVQLTK